MAGVVALVLVGALLTQAVLAILQATRRRDASDGAGGVRALLVPVSWVVALCFAGLVPVTIGFHELDPAECAPLSPGEASAWVAAAVGCVVTAGALSAWAAIRAARGGAVQLLVIGEVVASAAAIFVLFGLAGGTSC